MSRSIAQTHFVFLVKNSRDENIPVFLVSGTFRSIALENIEQDFEKYKKNLIVVFMGNDYNDFEMLVHALESLIVGKTMDAVRHVCRSTVVQNESAEVARAIRQYATTRHVP